MRKTVNGDETPEIPSVTCLREAQKEIFLQLLVREREREKPDISGVMFGKYTRAGGTKQMCLLMLHHAPAVTADMTISQLRDR